MNPQDRYRMAVELAAAFVANGDIRLGAGIRAEADWALRLGDLIPTLYEVLQKSEEQIPALAAH